MIPRSPLLFLFLATAILLAAGCVQTDAPPPPAPGKAPLATAPLQVTYAPGEIPLLYGRAVESANQSLEAIVAVPPGQRTVDNILLAFDGTIGDFHDAVMPLVLMGYVAPDPVIAEEGMEAEEASRIFLIETYSRRDLYDALRAVSPRDPDESRLWNETIRTFEHNGLKLPNDRLRKVQAMRAELSGLEAQFSANLNNDTTMLEFTNDELDGIPASIRSTFATTGQGKYLVSLKYPDYMAIMVHANPAETRKRMYAAYMNRQADVNIPLLEEAILLRHQIAQELGYPSWSEYQLDGRLAGNTSNVMSFLSSVQKPVEAANGAELAGLLATKRAREPHATAVYPWDIPYLQEIQKGERYNYNEEEVRAYFPIDRVLEGMFETMGALFDIGFEEVKDVPTWSAEVRLFRVANLSDGATIGYLYLDLYPRAGKYGYFSTTDIISGRRENGTYTVPVAIIICNFHAPGGDNPSLLTPDEISTLFHEGGHAVHHLLTRAPYATQSGFNVVWDFVETPSQALEEWPWEPEVLIALSGRGGNASDTIPADLAARVIGAHDIGRGQEYRYMLINSREDMRFHSGNVPVNVTEVNYQTYREVMGIPPLEGTHQPASFLHVMGGYDAGYYGYLWSKVYAANIVDRFEGYGMGNRTEGMRFRSEILERGNMETGTALIEKFLGRTPSVEIFFRDLEMNGSSSTPGMAEAGAGPAR